MKWFYDLKIAAKLPAIFCLLAAISGVTGWIGLSKVSQLKNSTAEQYAGRLVPMQDLAYANFAFLNARTDLRDLVLARDPRTREGISESIEGEKQTIDQRIAAFRKRTLAPDEQELLNKFGLLLEVEFLDLINLR